MTSVFKVEKYEIGKYQYDTIFITSNNKIVQIPVIKKAFIPELTGKQIELNHKDGLFDCVLEEIIIAKLVINKK